MKMFNKLSLAVLLILFSLNVMAQAKIAVVDIERAIVGSAYAKAELGKLQEDKVFKQNFDKYSQLREKLQSMQKEAEVNTLTWSNEQKQSFSKDLEKNVADINKLGQQLDQQKVAAERNVQKELGPKIKKIIAEMIKEKQVDILLKSGSVHYREPEFDLTQELIERLNKAQ